LADRYAATLIVNDRADVARLVGAAGVHLGQGDLSATDARSWLGHDVIIGVSTHNLRQALEAIESGAADYLGFGPIFATSSKSNPDPTQGLDGLREVRKHCRLPLVAIGGITKDTLGEVLRAGADAVALIGAIAQQIDPNAAARDLLERARSVHESATRVV
jgi:thiamine-phosphate pyrophosphorylase